MAEITRILDQLKRAHDGDAWYGPSVRGALEGVTAQMAVARPRSNAHSICDIVLHITAWTREVTRRLRTGSAQDPTDGDWPASTVAGERDWRAVLAELDKANEELQTVVAALDQAQLDERIGDVRDRALGSGVSRYVTLHGLAQHHAYHAGQISLVKKALREDQSIDTSGTMQPAHAESELRDLEEKLAQAWVAGNRAFIDELLSGNWTVTDPAGRVLTKEQVLTETFSSAERTIESMVVDDISVRPVATAAVVTGRTRASGSYRGQTATVVLRFTDVFTYHDGCWRIVASQGTLIAP